MATRVTLVSGTAEVKRREPRGEASGGLESVPAVQPVSYVDGKCNCCPYGYHIDLDFLNFCKDVADGSTLTNLKRIQRTKRKLRKSMEVMLHQQQHGDSATATLAPAAPPDVVHSTEASRLINMVQYEQTATHRVLRDIDSSVNATLASIETVQQEKGPGGPHSQRYMSSDSDDGYSYSPVSPVSSASSLNAQQTQTRFQAFATAQAPPPPPRRSSLHHHHHHHSSSHHHSNGEESSHFATSLSTSGRTDSMSSLSSVSTVSSEQVGGTGQYTSHASGMLNSAQPREMATAQVRRSDLRQHTTTVTTTSMTSEKLAATMATHFPQGDEPDGPESASPSSPMSPNTTIGKASLAAIRESMAISLQRMRDLEEQVKAIPILQVRISVLKEEKRLLALQLKAKSSATSANVRSIGVGENSVDFSPKISPRDFVYPTASSPFAPLASSPRSPGGMKTPPPTLPKPSRVKTVGVGDHSVVEPYLLQPDLPTGYVLTNNQVVNEIHTSIHEKETLIMGGSLDRRLTSSRTTKLSGSGDVQEVGAVSPHTHFTINQIQRSTPKHMTRSIGVGDGNVLDSSLQIHEKELRTVIIGGSGGPVGKRNVGIEVRVPTRSVGVSYSCDDARPATRTVGVNVTFDTSHMHTSLDFKGEQELRTALRGVLQRNVRTIGTHCDFSPELVDTGVQFESFGYRSVGCGGDDCRVDVDIRQPVIQRTVGVVAKPDTTSHRVGTDKDWVLEAGTNTIPLETYNKGSNTEVKRMGTAFTNTEQILRRKTGTQTDVAVFQNLDQLRHTGCNTIPTHVTNSSCNTIAPITCHRAVNTKSSELVVENFDFDISFDSKASNTIKEFRDMPTNTNPKDLQLSLSKVECVDVSGVEMAGPEPARPLTMQEQIIKRGVSQASAFLGSTSSSGSLSPTSPGGSSAISEDGSMTRTSVETVYLPATSHKMWSSQSEGSRLTSQSQVIRSSSSGGDPLATSTSGLNTNDGGRSSKTTITRTVISSGGEVGSGGQGQLVSGDEGEFSSSTSTITRTLTSGSSGQCVSSDLDTGDGGGGLSSSTTTRTIMSSDGTSGGLSSGVGQFTSREVDNRDGRGGYSRTITKSYTSRSGLGGTGETQVTKTVTTSGGEDGGTTTTEIITGPAYGASHGQVTEDGSFSSRKVITHGDLSGGRGYMERFGFGKTSNLYSSQGGATVQGADSAAVRETGGSSEYSTTLQTTEYSSSVEMGGNLKSTTPEIEGRSGTYFQETDSGMSSGTGMEISEGTANLQTSVSELQPGEQVVRVGGENLATGLSFSSSSSSSSGTAMSSEQPDVVTETVVMKRSLPTSSSRLSKHRHSDGARISRDLALDMQGAFSGRRVGSVEDFMPDDMRRLMNIEISGSKGKSRGSGSSGERSISKSSRTVTTKKITQNDNGTITVTKTITNPDGSVTTTTTTDVDIDEVGPQGQGLGKLSTGQFDLSKIIDEDETLDSATGESHSSQRSGGIKDSGYYESSSMTTVSQSSSLPGLDFDSMGSLERRQLKSIMKKSKSDSANPKRGISFAESVVGGTGSSSEEGASESDDDSTTSFEEGTYDGREGDIIYQCRDDEAIAEGAPGAKMYDQNIRETYELSEEMHKACEVVASYLVDSTTIQTKELNANISVVQGEWFRVSSHKLSSAHQVEDYLSSIKEISSRLLEYIVNLVDNNGNAAIHYCVSHCNFDIVGLLLDTEVCDVKRPNKAGYTPVMLATLGYIQNDEHREIIRRLFAAGDINAADQKIGQTALMLATSQCRADMVQLLLEKGASYNLQDFEGSTALMCACEHGHTAIVRLLLQAGADTNLQDSDGSTALMCACEHGHSAIVQMLLAQPDCDATLTLTDNETTALSIAMKEGHKDIGVMLYKHLNFSKPVSPGFQKKRKGSSSPTPRYLVR